MKRIENYRSVLAVTNLHASLAFYVNHLGFEVVSSFGEPPYVAEVCRDQAQGITLLCLPSAKVGSNSIATLVFGCIGIDELYREFVSKGVVTEGGIEDKEYGVREFSIKDPDGYILFFQQIVLGGASHVSCGG